MRVLAVVPARGGSKRLPRKNLFPLAGRPLLSYTLDSALGAEGIERIVVSSEDDEILRYCGSYRGVETICRPQIIANDDTPTISVIRHVLENLRLEGYVPDAVMTLQPTSPLRTAAHVSASIELLLRCPDCDSVVSCVEVNHSFHPSSLMKITNGRIISVTTTSISGDQYGSTYYARNGAAIYLTRYPQCIDYVYGGIIAPYIMKPSESVDIDTFDDAIMAERLIIGAAFMRRTIVGDRN